MPFSELLSRELQVKAFGTVLHVIGKEDLIVLKERAGRDKDLYDVRQLQKK